MLRLASHQPTARRVSALLVSHSHLGPLLPPAHVAQHQHQQNALASTTSSSARYNAQRRREWAIVATAAGGLAVSGSWYWFQVRPRRQAAAIQQQELLVQQQHEQQQQQQQQRLQVPQAPAAATMPTGSRAFSTSATASFTIPSRTSKSASGQQGHKIITLLTESQVNQKLRANEHSVIVNRPPGTSLIARYDSNVVPSNFPCEDRNVEIIVESDHVIPELRAQGTETNSKGDLFFGAVMDGHAGYHTSSLLTQKLISCVALELDKVFGAKGEYSDWAATQRQKLHPGQSGFSGGVSTSNSQDGLAGKMWRSVFGSAPGPSGQHSATFAQAPSISASSPSSAAQDEKSKVEAVPVSSGLEADPEVVKHAIRKAFLSLDSEIVNTPVELLKEYEVSLAAAATAAASSASSADDKQNPEQPKPIRPATASIASAGPQTQNNSAASASALGQIASSLFPSNASASNAAAFTATQRTVYEAMLPALSGSCALLAYVDSARGDLYMACTGDSRAIAGWYDHGQARWIIEPLSVDQTGRNQDEVRRMRSEHPLAEASTVIMRGRVLGGLEPTRAFGDARYKWDRSVQERLYETFLPGGRAAARGPPKLLETPPYVTARPEIVYRKIAPGLAAGSSGAAAAGLSGRHSRNGGDDRELRFVVMATDGLWDMLENEEVGALVAGHLERVRGTVLASSLHEACFTPRHKQKPVSETGAAADSATGEAAGKRSEERTHPLSKAPANLRAYSFEDDNLSTHLVRNALGGANRDRVAGLLAIPSPESRWYRDDITVNVILFNTAAQRGQQQGEATTAAAEPVKAKL